MSPHYAHETEPMVIRFRVEADGTEWVRAEASLGNTVDRPVTEEDAARRHQRATCRGNRMAISAILEAYARWVKGGRPTQ